MPLYTYKCQTCSHEEDIFEKVTERAIEPKQCPKCGSKTFQRSTVPPSMVFQLKGTGWFKNGY